MRRVSGVTNAIILAISLYFTLVWGHDAVRALTSPSYGLDEVWRSEFVFIIGRMFALGPVGLIKLAAFVAAVKLTVAGACAWHIVDRFRCMFRGQADTDVLEGALILIVAIGIISAGLAARSGNGEIVREYAIQLVLAGLATALCIAERSRAQSEPISPDDGVETDTPAYPGPALHP